MISICVYRPKMSRDYTSLLISYLWKWDFVLKFACLLRNFASTTEPIVINFAHMLSGLCKKTYGTFYPEEKRGRLWFVGKY